MGKAFGHRSTNIKGDLFQTHYSLTKQLLEKESFVSSVHEPCAGCGAIVKVLKEKSSYSIDYCEKLTYADKYYGDKLVDYLEDETIYDNIITNPPYGKITDDIIMHAKKHTKRKIAMLLRMNYLSGVNRYRNHIFDGLKRVYVFTRMPDLRATIRDDGKYPTAMIVYGWFIWENIDKFCDPVIKWIDNQEYVLKKGE